jgi:hypothetical protein
MEVSMTLLLRHGESATLEELQTIPIPNSTKTFVPVPHHELAVLLRDLAEKFLPGFVYLKSQYGLAQDGQQMFGFHTFKNSDEELGLSIGFRNSLNKTLSAGVVVGSNILVCSNLMLVGDITILRKHTPNVRQDLERLAVTAIYDSYSKFIQAQQSANLMKKVPLSNDDGFRLLGSLYGANVVSTRQIPVVKREWIEPSHEAFQGRTLWSFYNACTEALKSLPPGSIMEKHIQLHQFLNQNDHQNGVATS